MQKNLTETGTELTYFFSLNPKRKRRRKGRRRKKNDANITIKLQGSSEMLIDFKFPKDSCVFGSVWVSRTVRRI